MKIFKIFTAVAILFTIVGCSKEVADNAFEDDSYYISALQLKDELKNDKLIIVDAREEADYKKGHIEGAINIVWQQLSNVSVKPGEKGFGVVLEPKELQKVLRDLGFNNDSEVVIYSNGTKGWGEDGRILWTLLLNGFDNVKVLDGGYKAWTSEEYATSKESTTLEKGNIELSGVNKDVVIDTDGLKEQSDLKVIDTRDKEEYNGAVKYGEAKGGHIPGSINIPFKELYNEDGTVKSEEEIDAIMSENGISKDDTIVTYCTAGIRSASMFVVLKTYGYKNVLNYDESYYYYSATEDVE